MAADAKDIADENDEAAVERWGNPRNPFNPRQSAIQTRRSGAGHARAVEWGGG